jgi:glycosyltransferase involved in cell wall biosynthesis
MADIPLAIVMPVYNEALGLRQVIETWSAAVLDRLPGSVLIAVNDGSRDDSGAILHEIARKDPRVIGIHQDNGGHGAAILAGYRAAMARNAAWIFQTDSDAQFLASQFWDAWGVREDASMICGCRQTRPDSLLRRIGARLERWVIRVLFGVSLADANCAFRLMRQDLMAHALSLIADGDTAPNVEISIVARSRHGGGFRSIPVTCLPRAFGVSTLNLRSYVRATLRTCRDLLAFRRRWRKEDGRPSAP